MKNKPFYLENIFNTLSKINLYVGIILILLDLLKQNGFKSFLILLISWLIGYLGHLYKEVREGKGDFGYNARTDVYENLHAAGVVDPAKVTRVALENAASIAGMFLTTECVIVEKKEDKPEMPMGAPGMGGMGGMM